MRAVIAAALMLGGCQTIQVNGVKIEPGEQALWGLALATVAAAAFYLAEDDDEASKKCAQFVSVPTDKGGNICAD